MSKYIETKKKPLFFKLIRFLIRIFYRKRKFIGLENILDEPCIFISNHAQAHGPLTNELFFPTKKYIWCIGECMDAKQFPNYAMEDFWPNKPKWIRWFYKLIAFVMSPIATYVFRHADTIPVYKDARIIYTFKETVKQLQEGNNIIIFPEKREPFNDIINEFQDKFIDVAKLYYKKSGKCVSFIPMYNCPKLKKMVIGKPIKYDPNKDINEFRKYLCDYLKNEITSLALSLPSHYVVPYENVSKKKYFKTK